MNLRVALRGEPLIAFARSLVKLDGVRVSGGPDGTGRGRGYVVSCLGFKMVLSSPFEDRVDVALALVSREPRPPLAVLSELGSTLDRLMSVPPAGLPSPSPVRGRVTSEEEGESEPAGGDASRSSLSSSSLRPSALRPGKALVRRTELKRKTPLGRGPFRRP